MRYALLFQRHCPECKQKKDVVAHDGKVIFSWHFPAIHTGGFCPGSQQELPEEGETTIPVRG